MMNMEMSWMKCLTLYIPRESLYNAKNLSKIKNYSKNLFLNVETITRKIKMLEIFKLLSIKNSC